MWISQFYIHFSSHSLHTLDTHSRLLLSVPSSSFSVSLGSAPLTFSCNTPVICCALVRCVLVKKLVRKLRNDLSLQKYTSALNSEFSTILCVMRNF